MVRPRSSPALPPSRRELSFRLLGFGSRRGPGFRLLRRVSRSSNSSEYVSGARKPPGLPNGGVFLYCFQSDVSQTGRQNSDLLSASTNLETTHSAFHAGGMSTSSVYSAGSGPATASARWVFSASWKMVFSSHAQSGSSSVTSPSSGFSGVLDKVSTPPVSEFACPPSGVSAGPSWLGISPSSQRSALSTFFSSVGGFGSFFFVASPLPFVDVACFSLFRLFLPDLFLSLRRPWPRSCGGTCTVGLGGRTRISDPGPPMLGGSGREEGYP